ncbi:MAG: hypothetical protein QG656_2047, partial [Candidatus Hydrogenedentes bacterium]|nr:hypothetical protein [Candidatus Hydrogenedentota bacterium]
MSSSPCIFRLGVLVLLTVACAGYAEGFLPGQRVLIEAHNCYPYGGLWADRIDRALAVGAPVAIELDMAWYTDATGKSWAVLAHGGPFSGKEPVLREYFFEKVRPVVEKALAEGNQGDWPLYTLNINDLRGKDEVMAVWLRDLLTEYEGWLCTALKTDDPALQSSIDVKPVLVLSNDGDSVTKIFYDQVPAGGKLLLFGGRSGGGKATNFNRWWNHSWSDVEPEGQFNAGEWTPEDAARLKTLVDEAHAAGYWIR